MTYDADPRTVEWFESAFTSGSVSTRLRAVELLRLVDTPRRVEWLGRAAVDPDARVSSAAALVCAAVRDSAGPEDLDLFESDFADGTIRGDLEWEWEYQVVVCRGSYVPTRGVLVWLSHEDDVEARRLGQLKACVGGRDIEDAVPILVSKRFVNRYTRSPRSFSEAMRWHRDGRPQIGGP